MLDLARQWGASGIKSARVFAKTQGVTPWVLCYWRQRLNEQDRPIQQRPNCVSLTRVHVVRDGGQEDGDLEIVLVSGDPVRMAGGVFAETLRRVL